MIINAVDTNSQTLPAHRSRLLVLSITALGVVYGDIGTSPLYALRECFHGSHRVLVSMDNLLGVLSLIFWALIIIISIKYIVFVMRADNRGEGGIMALTALIRPRRGRADKARLYLVLLGLFGAALLYGDGMITPAISVLSAVEGLEVATPMFKPFVIPIAVAILIVLFLFQSRGTSGVGKVFGPVMLGWFAIIGLAGAAQIVRHPEVLAAVNPYHAARFFYLNGWHGFKVLGAVFLAVTGGEALYADMGHFGARPIRLMWYVVVLPALLLNYFGQGAALIADPAAAHHPFFMMMPAWSLYWMVALSTVATTIASQAVISGAFSLTQQAVQLGYSPRVRILHTSPHEIGQIYIPTVNWALMLATIGLVIGFRTSSNMAAAYGVAVTTTMVITNILLYDVARRLWGWNRWLSVAVVGGFLIVDLSFFGANMIKFIYGGWFPLLVAGIVYLLMNTWRRGRQILHQRLQEAALPDDLFLRSIEAEKPYRVPGTAIFLDRTPDGIPHALMHNIKHNKVLHENVVLLTVHVDETPYVSGKDRVAHVERGQGIYRLFVRFGFMETPNIPAILKKATIEGVDLDPAQATFFLGKESLIASPRPGMAMWRERLFAWMSRNATGAAGFFGLPPNRVVELGSQIEL